MREYITLTEDIHLNIILIRIITDLTLSQSTIIEPKNSTWLISGPPLNQIL
jgi:hypothetical protein